MAEETFEIEDLEQELEDVAEKKVKPNKQRRNIIIGVIAGIVILAFLLFSFNFFDISLFSNKINLNEKTSQLPKKVKSKKAKKVKYEVLYQKVTASDTSKIIKKLSFNDIQFNLKENGQDYTLLIDQNKLEEAKILLALNGLPSGSLKGYELLDDSQTLGVTEFDKKVRFLRALSGEIEKAILQFEMVEDVKVQIVMPKERLFVTKQPPVTAAVLLRIPDNYNINDSVVFSIMQLVAGAVENLELKNISIVNTKGENLSLGLLKRMEGKEYKNPFKTINEERKTEESKTDTKQEDKLSEEAILQPIQANLKNINAWFELKNKYEENMKNKLIKQLKGTFPKDSFTVTVTMELSSSLDGKSAEIKQTSVSILVDENNEEIFLDQEKKIQVFSIVAAVIGYKKNRDTIQLSRTSFESENAQKTSWISWFYFPLGLLMFAILGFIIYRIFRSRKSKDSQTQSPFSGKEQKNVEDFRELNNEIKLDEIIDEVRQFSLSNPKVLASLIEEMMSEEINVN